MNIKNIETSNRKAGASGAIGVALALLVAGNAHAATDTATLTVELEVTDSCAIAADATLSFGSTTGLFSSHNDAQTDINVTCTKGLKYEIGLSGGTSTDVNNRQMVHGSDPALLVDYSLYRNSGRTDNWGETLQVGATGSGDTAVETGDGNSQTTTVYGRILSGTNPEVGTYSDTITITVTYGN